MQLTWMGHSCIRVEQDNFVTVVDPGMLSRAAAAVGADALLISHQHLDHYDPTKIAAAVAARPGLPIWTNKDVAALLGAFCLDLAGPLGDGLGVGSGVESGLVAGEAGVAGHCCIERLRDHEAVNFPADVH